MQTHKMYLKAMLVVFCLIGITIFSSKNVQASSSKNTMDVIGIVNTAKDPLNIRQSPSGSSAVTGSAKKGSSLWVIGEVGNWYKISKNKKIGYVSKTYLKLNLVVVPLSPEKKGTVKKSVPLIRNLTKMNNHNGILKVKDKVTITGQYYAYYRVKNAQGKLGLIPKSAVTINNTTSNMKFTLLKKHYLIFRWSTKVYSEPKTTANFQYFRSMGSPYIEQSKDGKWLRFKDSKGKYKYILKSNATLKVNKGKQDESSKKVIYMDRYNTDRYLALLELKALKTIFNISPTAYIEKKTYEKLLKDMILGSEVKLDGFLKKHGIKANPVIYSAHTTWKAITDFDSFVKGIVVKSEIALYFKLTRLNNTHKSGVKFTLNKITFTVTKQ